MSERQQFSSLSAALEYIGHVEHVPVVAADELDKDLRYDVRIRAVLDKKVLPGPWRLVALFRRDWSIASDWLTWRLEGE